VAGYSLKSLSRHTFVLLASNPRSSFPTVASPTLLERISTPYRVKVVSFRASRRFGTTEWIGRITPAQR
jgi:hypothetical protein